LGAVPNFFTRCQPDSITDGSDVEAVSDQNIDFEDVENASFESMFDVTNMSQRLNVLGNSL